MPELYQWDFVIKKSGHMLGYFTLALATWHGLGWDRKRWWLAWLIATLYAMTDEFHQSFVPGRNALVSDVILDSISAAAALLITRSVSIFVKFNTK